MNQTFYAFITKCSQVLKNIPEKKHKKLCIMYFIVLFMSHLFSANCKYKLT